MIPIKSSRELVLMREACRITAGALRRAGQIITAGMTTRDLDDAVREYITSCGATPSFLGYNGFKGSACISVNQEVIHGIPGARTLQSGDIVSVDVGAFYEGFNGDSADTFTVGEVSPEAKRLIEATRASFYAALEFVREGFRVSDISHAVQKTAEGHGFSVVREYTGHGVGAKLHESPEVPNYGPPGRGARLYRGMTLAIEPMVNMGSADIRILSDGWTVVTADGKPSAHYEHTVLVTDGDPVILTRRDEEP